MSLEIRAHVIRAWVVLFTAVTTLGASAEPGAPVDLLVNGVSNPLAIERDTVRFTWRSADTDRGADTNGVSDPCCFKR